ncbi:hypothetical protein FG93_01469 [Bosea sp. LC85]|uniref:DUF4169 family protein n=1 Tax=Bosea sp. LC85 TaxID=1502851 RepID=UPI0004E2A89C|nr:DUF4169 family protein [Bosea sp. LC85]KFC73780.1 hypothetical protein FG93_01469 [Bosea sp. LC85]
MAEIINLRRARKQRQRVATETKADQNRIDFGRSKAERSLTEARREKATRELDGHKLTPPPDDKGENPR